jgi:hypothetical protein
MRFEELVLRIPGDEFRVRFHDEFTVMSGVGAVERQALADGLVGAVAGTNDDSELLYIDRTGRPVEIVASNGTAVSRYVDDGSPVLPLLGTVAPSVEGLRALLVLSATDLGLSAGRRRLDDDSELAEARALLSSLSAELSGVRTDRHQRDELERELGDVEAQLATIADRDTRRDYERVRSELDRVRSEAAAAQSGSASIEADSHLLDSAEEARALSAQWQQASMTLRDLVEQFGAAKRLDADEAASLRWLPDQPPSNLDRLMEAATAARRAFDDLDQQRRELAAARLPEPSDPHVADLAALDQTDLWITCRRVVEGKSEVHREQLALGGLATDHDAQAVVERIESAHAAVTKIEETLEARRLPVIAGAAIAAVLSLVLASIVPAASAVLLVVACAAAIGGLAIPRRRLQSARKVEAAALREADATSYLGFHIRRVEATVTPGGKQRLDEVAVRFQAAATRWDELVPTMSPEDALKLESEVRAYAEILEGLGDAAGELDDLRTELAERAEPAMLDSRDRLAEALSTYGIDASLADGRDTGVVERAIIERVALGRMARLQDELEDAEAQEEKIGNRLDDLLHQLGFADGSLEDRAGALELAVSRAAERQEARQTSRPRDEIDADLERLQAEASRLQRRELPTFTARDIGNSDVTELQRRRDELRTACTQTPLTEAEFEELSDRHATLGRRVAALESQRDDSTVGKKVSQVDEVQERLLAHMTLAGHAGPYEDSVPVVLDEPFLRIAGERKWELLDMLARLAEKHQVIYLTDDPFVGAWGRRRASAGEITLLEPIQV